MYHLLLVNVPNCQLLTHWKFNQYWYGVKEHETWIMDYVICKEKRFAKNTIPIYFFFHDHNFMAPIWGFKSYVLGKHLNYQPIPQIFLKNNLGTFTSMSVYGEDGSNVGVELDLMETSFYDTMHTFSVSIYISY